MFTLKWLVVAFLAVCALGLWLIAWKRMSDAKKEQRVYMWMAAVMIPIVTIISIWSLPS